MGKLHIPKPSSTAKKKSAGTAAAALAVCLVLLAALIGAAIGRYQTKLKSDGSVRAKEFYFTSDFLDGGIHTLAPESTELSFTLGNHADELRFSEMEIRYEVTVAAADGSASSAAVTYGNTDRKLGNDKVQDDTVTIKDLQPGKEYIVTAVGKGGYEESLTATIKVLSNEAKLYRHQETVPGEYTLVTLWNEGETAGSVIITYTAIPDNTNPNMTTWSTSGDTAASQAVTIGPHESKVFRFFGGGSVIVNGGTDKVPN